MSDREAPAPQRGGQPEERSIDGAAIGALHNVITGAEAAVGAGGVAWLAGKLGGGDPPPPPPTPPNPKG